MYTLPETLTLAEANAALASIAQAVGAGDGAADDVQIDAGALRNFDTSAIAVLLEARRRAQAAGRGLTVHAAPASMLALAGLYGVDGLLGFVDPRTAPDAAPTHAGLA